MKTDHFDPEMLHAMGSAYDAVLATVNIAGHHCDQTAVAKHIVALSQQGNRGSVYLYRETMRWLKPAWQTAA